MKFPVIPHVDFHGYVRLPKDKWWCQSADSLCGSSLRIQQKHGQSTLISNKSKMLLVMEEILHHLWPVKTYGKWLFSISTGNWCRISSINSKNSSLSQQDFSILSWCLLHIFLSTMVPMDSQYCRFKVSQSWGFSPTKTSKNDSPTLGQPIFCFPRRKTWTQFTHLCWDPLVEVKQCQPRFSWHPILQMIIGGRW